MYQEVTCSESATSTNVRFTVYSFAVMSW